VTPQADAMAGNNSRNTVILISQSIGWMRANTMSFRTAVGQTRAVNAALQSHQFGVNPFTLNFDENVVRFHHVGIVSH